MVAQKQLMFYVFTDNFQDLDEEIRPVTEFKFEEIFSISARNRINIDHLKERLRVYLDIFDEKERQAEIEQVNENMNEYFSLNLNEHKTGKLV